MAAGHHVIDVCFKTEVDLPLLFFSDLDCAIFDSESALRTGFTSCFLATASGDISAQDAGFVFDAKGVRLQMEWGEKQVKAFFGFSTRTVRSLAFSQNAEVTNENLLREKIIAYLRSRNEPPIDSDLHDSFDGLSASSPLSDLIERAEDYALVCP